VRPGRRGVVTPPYGSNAGGAQRRADVPKAWLPPAKFRAEIWGVSHGHRPLRPAGGREGGTPGSSCPTGGCGEPPRLPWPAAHSGAFAPRSRGMGGDWSRDHPQKGSSTSDNPSVTASPCQLPLHKGAFGDGGGLPRRFAPRNDSPKPLSFRGGPTGRRGNPSFLRWTMDGGSGRRVVGPYGRSTKVPATGRCGHRPLRKARSTTQASRRAAKRPRPRTRGMGGNRRKDHPKRGTAPATAGAAL